MTSATSLIFQKLRKHTSFFGIRLWILILACSAIFIIISLVIFFLICMCCRQRKPHKLCLGRLKPFEFVHSNNAFHDASLYNSRLLSSQVSDIEMDMRRLPDHECTQAGTTRVTDLEAVAIRVQNNVSTSTGRIEFSFDEIEAATNGLADENVIGYGSHSIAYHGVLLNNIRVAVKRLPFKRYHDLDLKQVVETLAHASHRNVVKLIGCCQERNSRMLVYEYIDNGNLHQWLHGYGQEVSPLTWNRRINIIQGTAKGLAYLHEDIDPKVIHGNIKSSNILLDHQWNSKISDVGLSNPYGLKCSHKMPHQSGYEAPEHASTGVLSEKDDVYSFGILIMEIVTGRLPIDESQPQVYLIDWLKSMIGNHQTAFVMDPKITEMPSSKELKRVLLVALRCVDPEIRHRPKMGNVVHMLEPRDLLLGSLSVKEKGTKRESMPSQTIHRSLSTTELCEFHFETYGSSSEAGVRKR